MNHTLEKVRDQALSRLDRLKFKYRAGPWTGCVAMGKLLNLSEAPSVPCLQKWVGGWRGCVALAGLGRPKKGMSLAWEHTVGPGVAAFVKAPPFGWAAWQEG